MTSKIFFPILLLCMVSGFASASCSTRAGNCALIEGSIQSSQKVDDGIWNKKIETPKDESVVRLEKMSAEAKKIGEDALSSRLQNNADDRKVEGIADSWCLSPEIMLSDNMKVWAKRAHWSLKWLSEDYDYPVEAGYCISGSFQQAMNTVASSYRALRLDVYPNQTLIVFSTR